MQAVHSYNAPQMLPQPINSGRIDISNIKPVNSGSVSLSNVAASDRGVPSERGILYNGISGNGKQSEVVTNSLVEAYVKFSSPATRC